MRVERVPGHPKARCTQQVCGLVPGTDDYDDDERCNTRLTKVIVLRFYLCFILHSTINTRSIGGHNLYSLHDSR